MLLSVRLSCCRVSQFCFRFLAQLEHESFRQDKCNFSHLQESSLTSKLCDQNALRPDGASVTKSHCAVSLMHRESILSAVLVCGRGSSRRTSTRGDESETSWQMGRAAREATEEQRRRRATRGGEITCSHGKGVPTEEQLRRRSCVLSSVRGKPGSTVSGAAASPMLQQKGSTAEPQRNFQLRAQSCCSYANRQQPAEATRQV